MDILKVCCMDVKIIEIVSQFAMIFSYNKITRYKQGYKMNKKPQFVNYIDSALENSISSITPISTDIIDFITLFDSENRSTRATLVASKSTRVKKDIKRF